MTETSTPRVDGDDATRLRREQLDILYDQSRVAVAATLTAAVVLAFALWRVAPSRLLLGWCALIVLVSAGRIVLTALYGRREASAGSRPWLTWFLVGVAASGTAWGLAAFLVPVESSLVHVALAVLWACGLTAGAVATFSVIKGAFFAFALPALAPSAVYLLASGEAAASTIGGGQLLFLAFISMNALHMHQSLNERLRLQVHHDRLLTALAQRTTRLAAANAELEAFCHSMSHDLRTPLRGIDGFARILEHEYPDRLDEQGRHYLDRIRSGTERMGLIIDDLLRLSEIGRAELRLETVHLGELADDVVQALRRREPDRQVTVRIDSLGPVVGDRALLRLLLDQLLDNAWKFTRDTPSATVELGIESRDGRPRFFVRDNGVGFDMSYADQLFKPFQRLHSLSRFEGTGIGLTTVERILGRHGGRAWAEARPGHGTTVWFTIDEEGPRHVSPADPARRR